MTPRTYHHIVIKKLTDNPGHVLYRDDIAQDLELRPEQVGNVINRAQRKDGIGKDIETVVGGQAWRYVPNRRTQQALRAAANADVVAAPNAASTNGSRSHITQRLAEFLTSNPDRVFYIDDLARELDITAQQAKVGVNNARYSRPQLRKHLMTVVPGKAWIFQTNPSTIVPSVDEVTEARKRELIAQLQDVAPTVAPLLVNSTPPVAPVAPVASTVPAAPPESGLADAVAHVSTNYGEGMVLFEKIGESADGTPLVRDLDGKVYRIIPL